MVRIRPRNSRNPTVSGPKIVASTSQESRFIRQALAAIVRFIRKKKSLLPDVEGDLSEWILTVHGFREQNSGAENLELNDEESLFHASAKFTNQWLGPEVNVGRAERTIAHTKEIVETKVQRIARAHRSGNVERSQTLISEAATEVMNAVRPPRDLFPRPGLTLEQFSKLRRATRATLVCLAIDNEHPLVLMARAAKGDRVAVLNLVKADKLFVHDRCCAATIKRAELQDDRAFIGQLTKALEYRPVLRRRDIFRVYYYILFLLEDWGVSLPTLNELGSILDPHGREFESLSAFERDFQRRRQHFTRMLKEVDEEVSVRGKGSPSPSEEAK